MIAILKSFNAVIDGCHNETHHCLPGDKVQMAEALIHLVKDQGSIYCCESFMIAEDWMESCKRINVSYIQDYSINLSALVF